MLSGVAYAQWIEAIDIVISTKTANTDLVAVSFSENSKLTDNVNVDILSKTKGVVKISSIQQGGYATIRIIFENTGTIPIKVDGINISDASSSDSSKSISAEICAYANEKRIVKKIYKLDKLESETTIEMNNKLSGIPVGQELVLVVEISYKDNGNDKASKNKNELKSQDITFTISPEYSRFNEG